MIKHNNQRIAFSLVAIAFALTGCNMRKTHSPSKQQVQDVVAAVLPPFLSLESIELEPISTSPETVKVNFKSIVVPKEDLYQVDRVVDGTPTVTLIKPIQPQGTKLTLYGSVLAQRIMDKWTIESPLMQTGANQFGNPRGAFGPQSYIVGSKEAIAALKQQQANAEIQLQEKKAALERQNREKIAREEQEQALRERQNRERIAREEQEQALKEQQEKNRLALETVKKENAAKRKVEEKKQNALDNVERLERMATQAAQYYTHSTATFAKGKDNGIIEDARERAVNAKKVAEEARKQYESVWGSNKQ